MRMCETCVCCGAIIPEGRMVCPNCVVAVNGCTDEEVSDDGD